MAEQQLPPDDAWRCNVRRVRPAVAVTKDWRFDRFLAREILLLVVCSLEWLARTRLLPQRISPIMVGAYAGVIFVNGGEGSLNMTLVVCQETLDANLAKGCRRGERCCTITDADGNRVFARYFCSGDIFESYRGPCTILSGTGNVAGITGGGEMILGVQAREFTPGAGMENVQQQAIGVAVWPALQYKIPVKFKWTLCDAISDRCSY